MLESTLNVPRVDELVKNLLEVKKTQQLRFQPQPVLGFPSLSSGAPGPGVSVAAVAAGAAEATF